MIWKAKRFFRLEPSERKLFAEAVLLVLLARVALVFIPFGVVVRCIGNAKQKARHSNPSANFVVGIARAVGRASRVVPRATCLPQALAGAAMISRRGYSAQLCIGVTKHKDEFNAHAWVECDDTAVVGSGVGFSKILVVPGAP
jgi:hypothetical protein